MNATRFAPVTRVLVILLCSLWTVAGCSDDEPSPPPPVQAAQPPAAQPPAPTSTAAPAQPAEQNPAPDTAPQAVTEDEDLDLTQLWSYGLISKRTGEPLITESGMHNIDPAQVSYGFNLVVDREGNVLTPRGTPLMGGEGLVLTDSYQEDHNTREYARVLSIMAPIRDAILYRYESTSREEWLALTEILTLNNIKRVDATTLDPRSILSTGQVYDYIAAAPTDGSPVMRYLEEAGLELKCLAFIDFDFTNPEGKNHCQEMGIVEGSGIKAP